VLCRKVEPALPEPDVLIVGVRLVVCAQTGKPCFAEANFAQGCLLGRPEFNRARDSSAGKAVGQSGPNAGYVENAMRCGVAPGDAWKLLGEQLDDGGMNLLVLRIVASGVDDQGVAQARSQASMAVNVSAEDRWRPVLPDESRQGWRTKVIQTEPNPDVEATSRRSVRNYHGVFRSGAEVGKRAYEVAPDDLVWVLYITDVIHDCALRPGCGDNGAFDAYDSPAAYPQRRPMKIVHPVDV
jgi:hypothetical protein